MKPIYEVKVWQDDDWWLARVVGASDDADPSPLNALTQARSLARIEPMARDLVATILDAEEDAFGIEVDYDLPENIGDLLCQARGAHAWLEAAQELWQERSAVAARALAERGYSLRETATLLGLSHQRVDQLLGRGVERERSNIWAFQLKGHAPTGSFRRQTKVTSIDDVDLLLVVRKAAERNESKTPHSREMDAQLREQTRAFLATWALHMSRSEPAAKELGESENKADASHGSWPPART